MFNQQEIKEPFLSQYFGSFLCFHYRKQNRLIINVGCHDPSFINFYSNIFCKVITIDPMLSIQDDTFNKIKNQTGAEILLHGVALSSMPRRDSIFYRCIENPGISTTLEYNYNGMKEAFPDYNWEIHHIAVSSLDTLFHDFDELDFLKIDAENEDVNILVGAKKSHS